MGGAFDLSVTLRSDAMRKRIVDSMDTLTMRGLREELVKEHGLGEDYFGDKEKRKKLYEEVDMIVVPVVKKRMREAASAAMAVKGEGGGGGAQASAAARPKIGNVASSLVMSLKAKQMAAMCREATIPYVHCYKECRETAVLESRLIAVLARDGLSLKSTMREVKEVKKRRKREQELDGIDTKNIVAGAVRNKTTAETVKPKTPGTAQVNYGTSSRPNTTTTPAAPRTTKTTMPSTSPQLPKASNGASTTAVAKPTTGTAATMAAPKPSASSAVEKKPRPKLVLDDEDDDW